MAARAFGWVALAYGVAGIALVIVGAIGGLDVAGRLEALALRADSTLAAAEDATRTTADAVDGVEVSLAEAETSADAASVLAREASATLDSLSVAMSLSILGSRPLEPLAADFATSSDQAAALADTLDGFGASLADTRVDTTRIAVELDRLADELAELRGPGTDDASPPPITLFVGIVLAWLAVQSLGAIIAGLALLRRHAAASV